MTLRTRLLIGLVAIVVAFGTAAYFVITSQQRYLVSQVDRQLEVSIPGAMRFVNQRPRPVQGIVTGASGIANADQQRPGRDRGDGNGDRDGDRIDDQPADSPFSELFVGLVTRAGVLRPVVNSGLLEGTPNISLGDVQAIVEGTEPKNFTVDGVDTSNRFRVRAMPRPNGTWVVAALPLNRADSAMNRLWLAFSLSAGVLVLVSALVAWWFVRLGLRPIRQMTVAADAVAGGARGHRVEFDDQRTETGRLGHAFNVMLDERQSAEDRLRRFVADASHELRTPITSIRGYVDLYQQGGLREPDRLDDAMRRVGSEAGRMGTLVEDLLLLANLDQGRPLRQEPVDLGEVLNDAAADAIATQPSRSVTLDAPGPGELVVTGDEDRLRQVVAVLVHNALVHTPETAAIELSTRRDGSRAIIEVVDHGQGMSTEEAEHAFERFYRGDPSRARHRGGSGLGLSIAKSIVEAHHGTIALAVAGVHAGSGSGSGSGTNTSTSTGTDTGCRFTITLPC